MGGLSHILDPGEMDRLVTIQLASGSAQDAYGDEQLTWVDVANVWAKIEWGVGAEGEDASQITNHEKVTFTMRYRTLDAKNRISYDGQYYDIESIGQLGRKRFLKVVTKIFDSNGDH